MMTKTGSKRTEIPLWVLLSAASQLFKASVFYNSATNSRNRHCHLCYCENDLIFQLWCALSNGILQRGSLAHQSYYHVSWICNRPRPGRTPLPCLTTYLPSAHSWKSTVTLLWVVLMSICSKL